MGYARGLIKIIEVAYPRGGIDDAKLVEVATDLRNATGRRCVVFRFPGATDCETLYQTLEDGSVHKLPFKLEDFTA
jgi:hypothetical protein